MPPARAGALHATGRQPRGSGQRAVGSALSLTAVPATAVGQARASPHGQHCGYFVHQPAGRYMITPHVIARPPSPPLESHAFQVPARCSHPGEAQSCGRHALTTAHFPGEWRLHPETIRLIWSRFGEAQVNLFASPESSHCQLYFSLTEGPLGTDALAHSWPRALRKYAFPPVSLLAQTLCRCSFPHGIVRDFNLQWKTASGLSYLLLQLAVTAGKQAIWRRALRRPHPARREVTCGDTDMDWPPGGTARLAIGTPRWWPPLSSGPTSVWRQPSLSADLRGRQRAAQSFWSSGCGPRICAMLLRDTATLRIDLPPPRAVLAGSPPNRRRAWLEPWARIQAGVSIQHESRPARTQGTLRLPKTLGGPRPFDGIGRGQKRCLADRNFSSTESSGSKGPLWSPARTIERSQEGTRGSLEGFILLAPIRNLTMRSCYPRQWWSVTK